MTASHLIDTESNVVFAMRKNFMGGSKCDLRSLLRVTVRSPLDQRVAIHQFPGVRAPVCVLIASK